MMTKEAFFINYISLGCNLMAYYYIVTVVVKNSKYHKLQKQKLVKKRWIELRKNAKTFQEKNGWQTPQDELSPPHEPASIQFMTLTNVLLALSNSSLILANIFFLLLQLPIEAARSSEVDRYVRACLGIGCCLSWMNCVTLLADLAVFRVVAFADLGC